MSATKLMRIRYNSAYKMSAAKLMRIRYISDLHLEFNTRNKFPTIENCTEDVCILAGDIGNPYKPNYNLFFKDIATKFEKIFVITGNHEYYYNDVKETDTYLTEYFKQYPNITFLNNSFEIYKNHCFIGSTLWSNISLNLQQYVTNDMFNIKDFTIANYNALHQDAVKFISDTIKDNTNIIMITHHSPSFSLIDAKYKGSKYNHCFYSHQDELIKANNTKIKHWIYGHTHTPAVIDLYGVNFRCNPVGYPGENPAVDFNKAFAVNHSVKNEPLN